MLAADCRSLLYLYSTFLTNDLVFPSHHTPTLVIIVVFAARSGANQIHTRKAENIITYHVFRYWISPSFTSQQERVAPTSGYIQVASEVACVVESLTRARRENRMQRLVGGRWRAKSLGTPRHGKTTNSKDLHTYCTCLTSWPRVIYYSEKDEGRYLFSLAIPFICLLQLLVWYQTVRCRGQQKTSEKKKEKE